MINLGSLNLSDMKIGTSSVLSGYVGTSLVYPLYTPANSIWGTENNNYVWLPYSGTTGLEYEWQGELLRYANNVMFGWTGSTSGSIWRLYYPNSGDTSRYNFRIATTSSIEVPASSIPLNQDMTLRLGNFFINKDGVDLVTGVTHTITDPMPVCLNMRTTKTKRLRLYDNGVLVFDGKPAVRNIDGVAGLLDSVSGNFYTNGTVYYD